jgi:hypothetical protein
MSKTHHDPGDVVYQVGEALAQLFHGALQTIVVVWRLIRPLLLGEKAGMRAKR